MPGARARLSTWIPMGSVQESAPDQFGRLPQRHRLRRPGPRQLQRHQGQIDDCLFGVDLQQSEHNIVRRKPILQTVDLGLRGDASGCGTASTTRSPTTYPRRRDMVVWYSADNVIARNGCPQWSVFAAFHVFPFQPGRGQRHYENNSVGIFLMYSDGVVVSDNYILMRTDRPGWASASRRHPTWSSGTTRSCTVRPGCISTVSPYQPDTTNRFATTRSPTMRSRPMSQRLDRERLPGQPFRRQYDREVGGRRGLPPTATIGTVTSGVLPGFRPGPGWGRVTHPMSSHVYADRIWQDRPTPSSSRVRRCWRRSISSSAWPPFTEPADCWSGTRRLS